MTTFKNTIINDTTYIQPPRGTTSQRPTIYTNIIRWTNTGSQSYSVLSGVTPTLTNTSWTAPTGVTQVEVLVVGGGGGGGGNKAGGGGGGGVIYNSAYTVTPGNSYTVTVGAGGAGANGSTNAGSTGSSSVFDTLTATGGGGGATDTANTPNNGIAGASGGGGARGGTGGAGTAALGFSGGNASNNANGYGGGGGGGAGGPGSNGHGFFGGGGGPGLNFNISGTPTWYAGGGGGMNYYSGLGGNYGGAGGIGGGGAGTSGGTAGTASTGGGGGGSDNSQAGYSAAFGGAGGSGVVIIRYVVASDNTDPRGFLRYNTDLNDIEVYENSYTGWVPQDPTRNFGGHNLIPASQTFYASAASTSNVSSTAIDDPFGGQNARRVTYLASGGASVNTQNTAGSIVANATYVFSVYMRKVTGNVSNSIYSYQTSGSGTAPVTTSWSVTGLSASLSTTTYTRVWATFVWAGTGTVSIVMPGYDAGNGVVMDYYGPQIELASTMGPYVNTTGVASPVPTVLNGYRTHAYTTTGTSSFSPAVTGTVEVLVVAGGGGGGANHAGGGGAGGVLYVGEYQVISGQQYTVTVGSGGAVGPAYATAQGVSGSNSIFGTLVAVGGGGAGNRRDSGTAGLEYGLWGGSGGGGGGYGADDNTTNWGGAGTLGQGYPGGTASFHTGAGGGGAGGPGGTTNSSAGASNTTVRPGNGGQGLYFPQFAHIGGYPAGWFGGGGAGNAHTGALNFPATPGWGGGGWPEGQVASGESVNGRANTGGGGGGSFGGGSSGGGNGGSGIVIVRYKN
jgi:hypothetical protein